jgi:hypothetical protein
LAGQFSRQKKFEIVSPDFSSPAGKSIPDFDHFNFPHFTTDLSAAPTAVLMT